MLIKNRGKNIAAAIWATRPQAAPEQSAGILKSIDVKCAHGLFTGCVVLGAESRFEDDSVG